MVPCWLSQTLWYLWYCTNISTHTMYLFFFSLARDSLGFSPLNTRWMASEESSYMYMSAREYINKSERQATLKWWHWCTNLHHALLGNSEVVSIQGIHYFLLIKGHTSFRIEMERTCRNSFVFSASWPATTLVGLSLMTSPAVKAATHIHVHVTSIVQNHKNRTHIMCRWPFVEMLFSSLCPNCVHMYIIRGV